MPSRLCGKKSLLFWTSGILFSTLLFTCKGKIIERPYKKPGMARRMAEWSMVRMDNEKKAMVIGLRPEGIFRINCIGTMSNINSETTPNNPCSAKRRVISEWELALLTSKVWSYFSIPGPMPKTGLCWKASNSLNSISHRREVMSYRKGAKACWESILQLRNSASLRLRGKWPISK